MRKRNINKAIVAASAEESELLAKLVNRKIITDPIAAIDRIVDVCVNFDTIPKELYRATLISILVFAVDVLNEEGKGELSFTTDEDADKKRTIN